MFTTQIIQNFNLKKGSEENFFSRHHPYMETEIWWKMKFCLEWGLTDGSVVAIK